MDMMGVSTSSDRFNGLCLKHPPALKFTFACFVSMEPAVIYKLFVILWYQFVELCAREMHQWGSSRQYDAALHKKIGSGKALRNLPKGLFHQIKWVFGGVIEYRLRAELYHICVHVQESPVGERSLGENIK